MRTLVGRVAIVALVLFAFGRAGAISYQTGFIDGTVLTTAGEPVPGVQINAYSLSSSGTVSTQVRSDGTYHLEVPSGDYTVEARYEWSTLLGSQTVTVADQVSTRATFSFQGGHVRGSVTRDQQPSPSAYIYIHETPPSSCAIADSCVYSDPNNSVSCWGCSVGGRAFACNGSVCNWYQSAAFSSYTDWNTGAFDKLVPVGDYVVDVSSGYEPGQYGQTPVGSTSGRIADGDSLDLGAVAYETGYVRGSVTRNGQPMSNFLVQATTNGGNISTYGSSGTYSLRLPLGNYDLTALDYTTWSMIAQSTASLTTAGATEQRDFAIVVPEATVSGHVTRDGEPARGAPIYAMEAGPTSCAVADSCVWQWDDQHCSGCTAGDRQFQCSGDCNWYDAKQYWANASWSDGSYSLTVKPGTYNLQIYSAYEPGQWGNFPVARDSFTVVAGDAMDRGEVRYQTGYVSGSVSNCGAQESNVIVYAASPVGSVTTTSSWDGSYSLRVPIGAYDVRAMWQWMILFGQTTANVVAGTTVAFSPQGSNGSLIGQILRAGQPAPGAYANIREKPPASCAIANGNCGWSDPNDPYNCWNCTVGDRQFSCGAGSCYWWNGRAFSAYTGSDGKFRTEIPAGDFIVDAYSAAVSGQYGNVLVGTVAASVSACTLSEVGASGMLAQPGTNVPVQLSNGVSLTFSQVTSGGEVSYVSTSTQQGGATPSDTKFLGLYYDFTVGATFTGSVTMCLPYDPTQITGSPSSLSIYHWTNNKWVKLSTTADTTNHLVCASTTSFSWYVVGDSLNAAPVADAGSDFEVAVDASCQGTVPLDGSHSSDPDGLTDIVSYQWSLNGASLGTGATVSTKLAPGTYTMNLVVTDSVGVSSSDTVEVHVVDKTPPTFNVTLDPSVLWPPDNKLALITPTFTATDNCTASPTVRLDRVTSTTAPASDIDVTTGIKVRATRKGTEMNGRTYEVVHTATDASGNASTVTTTVVVPHDQGK